MQVTWEFWVCKEECKEYVCACVKKKVNKKEARLQNQNKNSATIQNVH